MSFLEDLKTEAGFYNELAKTSPNSTKIIVAQRIASVRRANRILILENGEIVAECHLVYDNPEYGTVPGKRVYFSRMVTRKEYRLKGYGETIARYILDLAKEKGVLVAVPNWLVKLYSLISIPGFPIKSIALNVASLLFSFL